MNFSPEFFSHLEFLTGSVGVVLGFYFGIALLFSQSKQSRANLFLSVYLLALSLRTGKTLFHNYYEINEIVLTLFLNLFLLIGPSMWLYANHLYNNARSIPKEQYYWHYAPFVLAEIFSGFIQNNGSPASDVFYFTLFSHGFIYCAYTLHWLSRIPGAEVSPRKTAIKKWLLIFTLATTLIFIDSLLIFFDVVSFYPGSALLFSFVIVLLAIYGYRNLWLFEAEKAKYSNSSLNNEKAVSFATELNQLMINDKPYLDAELTLVKLATLINMSPKQLSQLINQTEQMNYSQYITKYRVEEVKLNLKNPDLDQYKISAIAFDSGFNSISSFNTAFRKFTGTTAVEYRESVKGDRFKDDFVCQDHELNSQ